MDSNFVTVYWRHLRTGRNIVRVVFDAGPFAPLCEKVMSEEDRATPRVICTENMVKFGRAVFEICEWINRHVDCNTRHS